MESSEIEGGDFRSFAGSFSATEIEYRAVSRSANLGSDVDG